MTTYGTIPAATPELPSSELISLANERIRSGLSNRKPWTEMINFHSFTFPATSTTEFILRLQTNLAYFRVNYAMIVLFILFLTLLWHPISLVVFIVTMSAWFIFYFQRDEPLVILNHTIDDRFVVVGLALMTIGSLFLTGVTVNIVAGVGIGVVLVLVHGVLRKTDDLFMDGFDDEERFGSGAVIGRGGGGGGNARMALKDTASSSYSL